VVCGAQDPGKGWLEDAAILTGRVLTKLSEKGSKGVCKRGGGGLNACACLLCEQDPGKGWVEGAAILTAVLAVAIVTATNDYSKDQQFRALNQVKEDIPVKVSQSRAGGGAG
jgi:hypothetical protein